LESTAVLTTKGFLQRFQGFPQETQALFLFKSDLHRYAP